MRVYLVELFGFVKAAKIVTEVFCSFILFSPQRENMALWDVGELVNPHSSVLKSTIS